MALERDGKYIRGTASEIAAYRDQQFAKNVSNVAAAGAAVIAVAGVAGIVAMVNASRMAKLQLDNYIEFYKLLRPGLAEVIFAKARRSAFWKTLITVLIPVSMGVGLTVAFAVGADAGPVALLPLVFFSIMGIFVGKTMHSSGMLGYLGNRGMRITHNVLCPH